MVKPEYCKNVIVGVIYKKKFAWYITKKDIWYLDYNKRYQAWKEWYKNMGRSEKRFDFEIGSIENFCRERFDIQIVDTEKADIFFSKIEKYKISLQELKKMYDQNEDEITFQPSFLVNFDKKRFYSCFPEPEKYEEYVPDGWKGYYEQFNKFIPEKEKYWN